MHEVIHNVDRPMRLAMVRILLCFCATGLFLIPRSTWGQGPREREIHFIPTSDVVRVAWMAARDEGYDPNAIGTFLDELRTADGKEPLPGYTSIGLYVDVKLVRSYSIRVDTGDVVDTTTCTIFRYPDLLKFKTKILLAFGTKAVSDEQIENEVGCGQLTVLPRDSGKAGQTGTRGVRQP
jgi:hypothetical protein